MKDQSAWDEMRKWSCVELRQEIAKGKRTLFSFRFHKKNEVKPHEIRAARRRVARLHTILSGKLFQKCDGE